MSCISHVLAVSSKIAMCIATAGEIRILIHGERQKLKEMTRVRSKFRVIMKEAGKEGQINDRENGRAHLTQA